MTVENTITISIPGIQPSLVEEAKAMRDRQLAETDRQRKEKEAFEAQEWEKSKQSFLNYLDTHAGTVLRQLDGEPTIENSCGNWFYSFDVAHAAIELSTGTRIHPSDKVGVRIVKNDFFESFDFCDAKTNWIENEKLTEYLLQLIGEIVEQYQKYRLLAAVLRSYNYCLDIAVKQTENDIAETKTGLWVWPDRAALTLYKIVWAKGGFLDSKTGKTHFEHESGWSLLDRPSADGYFHLLTPANAVGTRKLKINPSAIEIHVATKIEDVPKELMVTISRKCEVAIASTVSIGVAEWSKEEAIDYKRGLKDIPLEVLEGESDIRIVFPEYLPARPPSVPDLVVLATKSIELGQVPCLEVRLAIEAIANKQS